VPERSTSAAPPETAGRRDADAGRGVLDEPHPGAALERPRQMGPADVLELQRAAGNRAVQGMVQRQPTPPNPDLQRFLGTNFTHAGARFELNYKPTGGAPIDQRPISGDATVTLRLHITFKNFDNALRRKPPYNTHRFTRAQLADFNWTDDERAKFRADMVSSIQDAWSVKHRMLCTSAGFEELSAGVRVVVEEVADAARAHNKVTALKIPRDAPRFRSFVQGDTSTLDIRDPSETEEHEVTKPEFVRQVGPFELGKAELTPELTGQLDAIVGELSGLQEPGKQQHGLGEDLPTVFRGRASTPGTRTANKKLATERAKNAEKYVEDKMGWAPQGQARGVGEENATDEARFQRVDVEVVNLGGGSGPVRQNTAAHEAGHMFGLGDEYQDVEAHRLTGDQPSHFGDVESELGTDAANDLLAGDSGSMMSVGSRVEPGHYVPFLQALEAVTGKQWTIPH
jgi:outer membrane protein OmpA-like peptidoglycan-associated protein